MFRNRKVLGCIIAIAGAASPILSGASGQGVGDLMLSWRSPDEHYSVSAYVRNVPDNRYITSKVLATETPPFLFTPTQYDPRTFGVILNARL